jgi:hypothetical protein
MFRLVHNFEMGFWDYALLGCVLFLTLPESILWWDYALLNSVLLGFWDYTLGF